MLVVRRIFSDILLVLGLKKVEKHCSRVILVYARKNKKLSLILLHIWLFQSCFNASAKEREF
jgi:hypothetical protein